MILRHTNSGNLSAKKKEKNLLSKCDGLLIKLRNNERHVNRRNNDTRSCKNPNSDSQRKSSVANLLDVCHSMRETQDDYTQLSLLGISGHKQPSRTQSAYWQKD